MTQPQNESFKIEFLATVARFFAEFNENFAFELIDFSFDKWLTVDFLAGIARFDLMCFLGYLPFGPFLKGLVNMDIEEHLT